MALNGCCSPVSGLQHIHARPLRIDSSDDGSRNVDVT
jgi:hypothetical protein